jgi:non-haem dioxygenase in morphine synthesis N-terminal
MTYAIPVIDLENVQLEAVRAGSQELGAVQVVNHGVPGELSADLERRMARLLSLPRAEKARLASPHPYRGWRQWPDDFGRLELERFNVAQFDSAAEASAAGVSEKFLGLCCCSSTRTTRRSRSWPRTRPTGSGRGGGCPGRGHLGPGYRGGPSGPGL